MMIVSVDPLTKRVGMLSIPRDLWVPIPGFGENRINTAYFDGELPKSCPAADRRWPKRRFNITLAFTSTTISSSTLEASRRAWMRWAG